MLSRVASSIYWMSRYVERAENLARFLDVTFGLMLDLPSGSPEQWLPLVATTGDNAYFDEHYGDPTRENVVRFLSFDSRYPNSIFSCLRVARENARTIREAISSEMWEQLNNFYHMVETAAARRDLRSAPQEFLQDVRYSSHQFCGITDGTLSHGEGWQFARLGRTLERADKTSRLLDVKFFLLLPRVHDVGTPTDDLQWSAVLRSLSGFEMFRKRHRQILPERVVGFLILDRLFPRAIMHCVDRANEALHAISGSPEDTFWNSAEKRLGQLRSELAYCSVTDIISSGLHEFLDALQVKINKTGDAIFETFFSGASNGTRRSAYVSGK
ncbi:MAG: alpha-E domain-containing protein [Planctomycetes bacterium]|nr:alpha-E domain-containing protein [Planctomycetota bacterium]